MISSPILKRLSVASRRQPEAVPGAVWRHSPGPGPERHPVGRPLDSIIKTDSQTCGSAAGRLMDLTSLIDLTNLMGLITVTHHNSHQFTNNTIGQRNANTPIVTL